MQIENADFAGIDDGPDGIQAGAVVLLVVFSVLHKPLGIDVLFKLRSNDKVVILAIYFAIAFHTRSV